MVRGFLNCGNLISSYSNRDAYPELPKELNLGICSKSYRGSKYDFRYIA